MNLKSYNQYLNEDLNGEYNYYGAGSLFPLVQKLKQEGKSPKVIYAYLTTLGIDEMRKQKVISLAFMNESIDFEVMQNDLTYFFEASLFEEDDKPSPDEINDLLNADSKDLSKGIDPKKAKPDIDFKKSLDKLKADDSSSEEEPVTTEPVTTEPKEIVKSDAKSNINALQAVIRDAEKLEKIREILKESRESQTTKE